MCKTVVRSAFFSSSFISFFFFWHGIPAIIICPIILWTVGAPHGVTTNLRHSSLSSAFLTVSLSPKPVHSQMLSSHRFFLSVPSSPTLHSALEKCLGKAQGSCNVPIPLQLALFHNGQEFFVGSSELAGFCFEPLHS